MTFDPTGESGYPAFPALDAIERPTKDILRSIRSATKDEMRFLVDNYYAMQYRRIRSAGQARALDQGFDDGPREDTGRACHATLDWLVTQEATMEKQIQRFMEPWALQQEGGEWLLNQKGVGGVLAAGLLCYIDIEQAPTVGHIWRYAGLDPTLVWYGREGGKKLLDEHFASTKKFGVDEMHRLAEVTGRKPGPFLRLLINDDGEPVESVTRTKVQAHLAKPPHNAPFKKLCWKVGDSFVKVSGYADARWGQFYRQSKAYYQAKNEAGEYAEEGARQAAKCGKGTEPYKAGIQGKLCKGHIDNRARRRTVKVFLAALHHQLYVEHFGTEPPLPYALAHLDHAHMIK